MSEPRKMFEEWCTSNDISTTGSGAYGGYLYNTTEIRWEAWQAATAAEREVSDKLEKALVRLMASADASGYTANIGSMDESIKIAYSALAEVAAIRATHTNREKAD